jgi:hypothetical protein
MPITKNLNFDIDFVTNCVCSSTITALAGVYTSWVTTSQTGVYPLLLSQYGLGLGLGAVGDTTITLSMGIVSSYDKTITSHPILNKCRIYVPKMSFNPSFDEQYFSNPIKTLMYEDRYIPSKVVLAAGGTITNSIITQSVSRPRYLLVLPFLGSTVNSCGPGTATDSPLMSPFSCSPNTTASYAYLTNIQVRVGGKPLFQENLQYSYLHYMENFRTINAISGGQLLGVSNGLITFDQWCASPIYLFDLSRVCNEADDLNAKQVNFSCKNSCTKGLDLYFSLNYLRVETLNTALGVFVNQ